MSQEKQPLVQSTQPQFVPQQNQYQQWQTFAPPQQVQMMPMQPQMQPPMQPMQQPPPGYRTVTLSPGQAPPPGAIPVQYVYGPPTMQQQTQPPPSDDQKPADEKKEKDEPETTTKVITKTRVIVHPLRMGARPTKTFCRNCGKVRTTVTHLEPGSATYCAFLACVLCGCWGGCCLLPFCMDDLKDVWHHCSVCHSLIGIYHR